jgi:hypothetical protein
MKKQIYSSDVKDNRFNTINKKNKKVLKLSNNVANTTNFTHYEMIDGLEILVETEYIIVDKPLSEKHDLRIFNHFVYTTT